MKLSSGQPLADKLRKCNQLRALIEGEVDIETFEIRTKTNPDAMKAGDDDDEAASQLQNDLAAVNEDEDVDAMDNDYDDDDSATEVQEGVELEVTGKPNDQLARDLTYNCGCVRDMSFMKELISRRTLKSQAKCRSWCGRHGTLMMLRRM